MVSKCAGIVGRLIAATDKHWNKVNNPQAMPNYRRHRIGIVSGIVAALSLTVVCYWPSLGGPFLFDDIPNLELIGERGGLTSVEKTLEFILSAQSGPLGRPLSLASFTLDGQAWPTDPRPFRITNLIIHLLNGLLLFFVTRLIFAVFYKIETAEKLALVCVTFWLLHPLLVSTTAYIIQRMTQLSSLFTLAGLLSYLYGRRCLARDSLRGWTWIVAGMGVSGALALLSKETGILLPAYALVLEVTVFGSTKLVRRQRTVLIALLCAPLLAMVAYMTINWESILAGFELRSFTVQERLLTQGVVLFDYLRQIIAPRLFGLGLFHDDFPVSTGLLTPVVTLASLLGLATLVALSVGFRKSRPLISLGILWFFIGHSLESGPIALELYFEHRNYLALLGPLIAFCSVLPGLNEKMRRALPVILITMVAMESFLTWQSAAPWGSEDRLMQIALREHPGSLRAQQYVANTYIAQGNYSEALNFQENLVMKFPVHAATRLSILNLRCILNVLTHEQTRQMKVFLRSSEYDPQLIDYFGPLSAVATSDRCVNLGVADVNELFDAVLRNPETANNSILRGATHYHKGKLYKMTGDLGKALEQFDLSYSVKPQIDILLQQAVWLIEAGEGEQAEHYLHLARQHGEERLVKRDFRETDISTLQNIIDAARNSKPLAEKHN